MDTIRDALQRPEYARLSKKQVADLIHRADADKNGVLDYPEFVSLVSILHINMVIIERCLWYF